MSFRIVKLLDISKPKQWRNLPSSQLTEEGYFVYGANGIIGKYSEYNHEYPTLVITCRGATCGSLHITRPKSYINSNAMALDDLSDTVNIKYLFYALFNRGFKDVITGSAQPQITREGLSKIKIPIPSLSEQIRIAEILTQAENLITQRKESILLLDELLKSTFLEMFGDPLGNPKKFPIKKLNEFYISPKEGTKCGPFGSALKKGEYKSEGIPVWVMDNISKNGEFIEKNSLWVDLNKFNDLKSYSVINNDVIISRAGTVGKMCVVKTNQKFSLISTNLIRVRFGENLLPLHFVSLMKYSIERIAKLRTGAEGTFTHMNTGILDNIIFPYPPLKLQNQFASIVEKVDSLKREYQASLKELENIYGVLSQKAFKGELKAKEYANNEVLGMVAETEGGY